MEQSTGSEYIIDIESLDDHMYGAKLSVKAKNVAKTSLGFSVDGVEFTLLNGVIASIEIAPLWECELLEGDKVLQKLRLTETEVRSKVLLEGQQLVYCSPMVKY